MARKIWGTVLILGAGLGGLWGRHQQQSNVDVLANPLKSNATPDTLHYDSSEESTVEKLPDYCTTPNSSTRNISAALVNSQSLNAEIFKMMADKNFSAYYYLQCIVVGVVGAVSFMFCCCGIDERHDDEAIIKILTCRNDEDDEEYAMVVQKSVQVQSKPQRLLSDAAETLRERLRETGYSDDAIPRKMMHHLTAIERFVEEQETQKEQSKSQTAEPRRPR